MRRRDFIASTAAAGITLGASLSSQPCLRAASANSKIIVGVMGLGGRGSYLAQSFAERPDVEVAYLCDVDSRKFARTRDAVEEAQGKAPKQVQDFRRILDDKSVDVLVNATPDHWHALASILACQAGKDVFVEKPMTHNAWEGRKMIEAADKYKRVIQVGMQSRSAGYLAEAAAHIRSGKLGEIHLVRVFNMMQHPFVKRAKGAVPVPAGYDHDLWCGPAPLHPYDPSRRWLNEWDFSCGPIAGDAVHQLDLARFLIGDPHFPDTVVQSGGVNALTDGREVPDTQIALFEYGKLTLLFEAALWTPYMTKTALNRRDKGEMPNWPFNATRIEILGTKGFMYFGRHGDGWQVFDEKAAPVVSVAGKQADKEHQANFLECVRSRKQPAADVRQGHYSAMLSHLANISYRVGNKKLQFDAATETFRGAPDADRLLRRSYRAPWVVPDTV